MAKEKPTKAMVVNVQPCQTIRQAVGSTGLSERYLRRLLAAGQLPHVMSGNRCLVCVPELLNMMQKEATSSASIK